MFEFLMILLLVCGLTVFVYHQIPSVKLNKPSETVQMLLPSQKDDPNEVHPKERERRVRVSWTGPWIPHALSEQSPTNLEETHTPSVVTTPSPSEDPLRDPAYQLAQIVYKDHPFLGDWWMASQWPSPSSSPQPVQSEETQTVSESSSVVSDQSLQTSLVVEEEAQEALMPMKVYKDQGTQTEGAEEPRTPGFKHVPTTFPRVLSLKAPVPLQESESLSTPFSLQRVPSTFSHEIKKSSEDVESPLVSSSSRQSSSSKEEEKEDPHWVVSELVNKTVSSSLSKKPSPPGSDDASYVSIPKARISTLTFSVLPEPEASDLVLDSGKSQSSSRKKSSAESYEEIK